MKIRIPGHVVTLLAATLVLVAQQPLPPASAKLMQTLASKCDDAKQYSWEGELLIEGKKGNTPWQPLSLSKVKLAIAGKGKSYLRVEPSQQEAYWLISDGQKSWAYLPQQKQYTEEESATISSDATSDDAEGQSDQPEGSHGFAEAYARLVVPTIATVYKNARGMTSRENAELKIGKQKVSWPSVVIATKPDEHSSSDLVEFALDPDHMGLGRMVWVNIHPQGSESIYIRTTVLFTAFSVGEDLPDTLFTFDPPKKAKLVETLPIPGFEGSAVLNHAAPDFELKSASGEKVRLSDFRGKVVLLNFWATWCGPCRSELPTIAKLYGEFKDSGLVVYGANDEDRAVARKYLEKEGLQLPFLDDSSQKAYRLYRVNSIPAVFIIDPQGKVVKYFRGGHDEESLRAALKTVGIGK
jgi:peroxiredoxin/outer membrane lipoprotein-sorting protein